MSKSARSGVSSKVTGEVLSRLREENKRLVKDLGKAEAAVDKLKVVRALWLAVQNEPQKTVADMAFEFYEAVGKALEGRPLADIELRSIDRGRAKQHDEET